MNKINTDYMLRRPEFDELRRAFGSLRCAMRLTGGDIPTACFYIANPALIGTACEVAKQPGEFAHALHEQQVRDDVIAEFARSEKPTIKAAASAAGVGRELARRHLVRAGLWPRADRRRHGAALPPGGAAERARP